MQQEHHHSENLSRIPLSSGPLAIKALSTYLRPIIAMLYRNSRSPRNFQRDERQRDIRDLDDLASLPEEIRYKIMLQGKGVFEQMRD